MNENQELLQRLMERYNPNYEDELEKAYLLIRSIIVKRDELEILIYSLIKEIDKLSPENQLSAKAYKYLTESTNIEDLLHQYPDTIQHKILGSLHICD
jgi:hypothetical protein